MTEPLARWIWDSDIANCITITLLFKGRYFQNRLFKFAKIKRQVIARHLLCELPQEGHGQPNGKQTLHSWMVWKCRKIREHDCTSLFHCQPYCNHKYLKDKIFFCKWQWCPRHMYLIVWLTVGLVYECMISWLHQRQKQCACLGGRNGTQLLAYQVAYTQTVRRKCSPRNRHTEPVMNQCSSYLGNCSWQNMFLKH